MQISEQDYKNKYSEDDAVGWDFIEHKLFEVYGNDTPRHYATLLKFSLGGNDPLDGISIYDQDKPLFHRHMISYGMSELYYSPDKAGKEYSKWGFEFTFRIAPFEGDEEYNKAKNEPMWAIGLMQNLARYVFDSGKYFDAYHFIPCNESIRAETETSLVGIAFVPDPQLDSIDTPHGKVVFLQMVGLTQQELDWLFEDPSTDRCKELIDKIRKDNPMLITDLNRSKSYL